MTIKTRRILCILSTALMFILVGAFYRELPEQIPTHWGISGSPDFSSKVHIWGFAALGLLLNLLFEFLPKIDPRYRNYMKFIQEYNLFCVFMNGYLLAFLIALILQAFRPGSFEMVRFMSLMLALTFLVIGNMLPKFKSNFFSGIKTPWALSDEENWRKTQRLGGKLFFLSGAVWLLGTFLISNLTVLFAVGIGAVLAASLVPYIMSYLWWKRAKKGA